MKRYFPKLDFPKVLTNDLAKYFVALERFLWHCILQYAPCSDEEQMSVSEGSVKNLILCLTVSVDCMCCCKVVKAQKCM